MLELISLRLLRVPIEHQLCIYTIRVSRKENGCRHRGSKQWSVGRRKDVIVVVGRGGEDVLVDRRNDVLEDRAHVPGGTCTF